MDLKMYILPAKLAKYPSEVSASDAELHDEVTKVDKRTQSHGMHTRR